MCAVKNEQDSILSVKYMNDGKAAGKLGDFELALENFEKVLVIRKKMFGDNSPRLATLLNNIGIQYKNLENLDKAVEYYKKAENLCLVSGESQSRMLGAIYVNLGNVYMDLGDLNQALLYQQNAYRILKKDSLANNPNFHISKLNIAEIYLKLGFADKAIRFAKSNLKHFPNDLKLNLYDLIALAYKKTGDYALSNEYYQKAIQIAVEVYGKSSADLIFEYLAYSSFLLSHKQYDKALLYSQKANDIVLDFYGKKSKIYSSILFNYGEYHYYRSLESGEIADFVKKRKESFFQAIQYYQQSIVALVDSFQTNDPLVNPSIKNVISENQLVEVVKKKALVLGKIADIFHSEFDNRNAEKYLNASLNSLSLAIELIHKLQIGFENEDSKLFLSQNQQSTFFEAINTAYKLYNLTKDRKYVLKAFEFSEKSKSSNLLASIKDVKAKEFGGIPDSLLGKEKELKSYISVYKSKLFEESHLEKTDTQKVNLYSSKIFKYNEEYNRLIDSFEKSYPQYFSLKYENKVIRVDQIQAKLNKRQALIEYFLREPEDLSSQGELYLFTVTSDSVTLIKENVEKDFISEIQTFHDFLISPNYFDTKKKDYVDYSVSAFNLYQKLLKPVAKKINGKSITIIPHEKLSYIPFDALISEMPDTTRMNFRDLKYVIRDYSINYGYSATLLYESEIKRNGAKKALIFSPEYDSREPRRDVETGNVYFLGALPGAKEEIKSISKYVSSVSFVDKMAQEETFKREANEFDILHLAMHTIINDSLPMLSKLVFSKPGKGMKDDGYLNSYEIYNMKLNARLAVLSACETGSGKLQGGEGVMSMARGFIYSGCPSVIMTLWQVEDKSGVNIMSDFYRYLSKGKRKDVALRMAKLNHLENSDPLTAHPHFWLGYVNIGNVDPLYTSKDVYFVIFIFIVVLILLFDFRYRRKKMK